tara:strand:- start:1753 stop:2568 length:816 start_codon:yes stop_codon:yes gene_type:complete
MNFLLLTALKAEANPLIKRFNLKRDLKTQLFINKNISLLITGIGKVKTQARIKSIIDLKNNWDETILVNIGIAGGEKNKTKIGSMYFINKILDEEIGNIFFPDVLIKHNLEETSLTTVLNSVTSDNYKYSGLVDMEASMIFELISSYTTCHRLVFLKIVSDYMDISDWKSINVQNLIHKQIENISKIINSYNNQNLSNRIILDNVEINLLTKYSEKLKLTKTQSMQLMLLSENFKKNNGMIVGLDFYFKQTPKSKQERNKVFDKIKKYLSS